MYARTLWRKYEPKCSVLSGLLSLQRIMHQSLRSRCYHCSSYYMTQSLYQSSISRPPSKVAEQHPPPCRICCSADRCSGRPNRNRHHLRRLRCTTPTTLPVPPINHERNRDRTRGGLSLRHADSPGDFRCHAALAGSEPGFWAVRGSHCNLNAGLSHRYLNAVGTSGSALLVELDVRASKLRSSRCLCAHNTRPFL